MKLQFSRPDRYLARTGSLYAEVTEHRIDGAPGFMRGLRALFVSDTHVLGRTADGEIDALVDRMAATQPDILLLGGDYSDDMPGAERLFRALSAFRPPLGAYGVVGNNDAEAWEGRLKELRRVMARAGCRLLLNASVRLELNGGRLWIGGVDEYRYGRPDAAGLYPGARPGNGYRILLSHYPRMPVVAPDMMLSGHTHGGQFNLLGITPYAVGFERIFPPRLPGLCVAGLRDIGGMKLLVSKGIGASRLQLRVGVRPEINLLIFE